MGLLILGSRKIVGLSLLQQDWWPSLLQQVFQRSFSIPEFMEQSFIVPWTLSLTFHRDHMVHYGDSPGLQSKPYNISPSSLTFC